MNNEPVAWMDEINTFVLDEDYKQFPKSLQNGMIPLYTHPVEEQDESFDRTASHMAGEYVSYKNLTDEEIALVWDEFSALQSPKDIKDFARAILRKAQE